MKERKNLITFEEDDECMYWIAKTSTLLLRCFRKGD